MKHFVNIYVNEAAVGEILSAKINALMAEAAEKAGKRPIMAVYTNDGDTKMKGGIWLNSKEGNDDYLGGTLTAR